MMVLRTMIELGFILVNSTVLVILSRRKLDRDVV